MTAEGRQVQERVDHAAEARQWVEAADREASDLQHNAAQSFSAVAQVHASLAIAEQLERLNEKLASVIGVSAKEPFGSSRRHVRTNR
jgi:phytoene/squalene synthetase